MNSILKFIALAMCVSVAISATTGTFSSPTLFKKGGATAVEYTNGWVVELTAAGWVYGDAIVIPSGTTGSVTYTTLTKNAASAFTGVGLAGASCTAAITSTTNTAATLVGTGAVACPADIATLYTSAPAASPATTSSTSLAFSAAPLVLNQPVQWALTAPASTASKVNGLTVTDGTSAAITVTAVNGATPTSTGAGLERYGLATLNYAFYVETAGTDAVVCFQTAAQYKVKAGDCGTVPTTSSAGILSATISGFVAMVALIFFN